MRHLLTAVAVLLGSTLPLAAQYYWAEDGVPVRQGAHLGWNGSTTTCGDEVVVFYYHCLRDGTRDVWAQRFTAAGSPRWGEGRLVSGNVSEQRYPEAAAYSDGSVLVVWEDYGPGRYRDLMGQRLDENGVALWPGEFGVTVVADPRDQFEPLVAIDSGSNGYVAWTDDRETIGDQRLSSWVQIFSAGGTRVGPVDGIRLVDRVFGYCVPVGMVARDGAAYVLMEAMSNGEPELILQKVLANGTVVWPEDPGIVSAGQPSQSRMIGIPGGFAVAWRDFTNDFNGDVRLLLIDENRAPLAGWPEAGMVVAEGPGAQAVAALSAAPGGDVVVAWGSTQTDLDLVTLHVTRYTAAGVAEFANVPLGTAAMQTSPVDLAWDNGDLLVGWTDRADYISQTVRTQKVAPSGALLWGAGGNAVANYTGKSVRTDLVKPEAGPARVFFTSGRTVFQPESLFTAQLTAEGLPGVGGIEAIVGGITYDVYDPQAVRIGVDRALLIWSDSRESVGRDVYVQIIDGQGTSLLEPQGRKLPSGLDAVNYPPAAVADGLGGAFVSWAGDSAGVAHYLYVQHIGAGGETLWATPARVSIGHGLQTGMRLVPDASGGVYAVYSAFSSQYVLRAHVAHVNAYGILDWTPPTRALDGPAGNDMVQGDACRDGSGGVFVAATVGPWWDTDVTVYHLNSDGTAGDNWTLSGRTYGDPNRLDERPRLQERAGGAVLAYLRANTGADYTYSVRGLAVQADGTTPWGSNPRSLVEDGMTVTGFQLAGDGGGSLFVVWQDLRDSLRSQVRINRFGADGYSQWDADGVQVCEHLSNQYAPAMVPDESGGVWIVWEDNRHSDEWGEVDLYAMHLDASGNRAVDNGFVWPAEGHPMADLPTYQERATLVPWMNGGALAVWVDRRSSNPGRCCGAGSVGDVFENIYAQVLSDASLSSGRARAAAAQFELLTAYPNPFNPVTMIEFRLPVRGAVKVAVYDLLGREVDVLADGVLDAGTHRQAWNGDAHAAGLYFVRMQGPQQTAVRKVLLLK